MITNFEEITKELTPAEKKLVPVLIRGFKHHVDDPIKAPDIVYKLTNRGYEISEPRLRKLCNLIRAYGILPLIATSKGYYISYDSWEIRKQITSLKERAEGIMAAAQGLEKYLERVGEQKRMNFDANSEKQTP